MNVRLRKFYSWTSGLVWNGEYMINAYRASLELLTQTDDQEVQNLAYNRMNYWIQDVMQDAVLLPQQSDLVAAFQSTGQRVITLPGEPVDQLVGMMLYCKLNAIMDHQMIITELAISSDVGDDIAYCHDQTEDLGPFAHEGWWSDTKPLWTDTKSRRSKNNVIAINRIPEWKDLDLEWNLSKETARSDVLFASFRKDEEE
jgi:hypothetical protein